MEYCKPAPDNPHSFEEPTGEEGAEYYLKMGELMLLEYEVDIEPVELPNNIEVAPWVLMALEKFITIAK